VPSRAAPAGEITTRAQGPERLTLCRLAIIVKMSREVIPVAVGDLYHTFSQFSIGAAREARTRVGNAGGMCCPTLMGSAGDRFGLLAAGFLSRTRKWLRRRSAPSGIAACPQNSPFSRCGLDPSLWPRGECFCG
jgi:hypothetical protein